MFKIDQGSNGNWFVRLDGVLIAGFTNEEDANIFVKAKMFSIYQDKDITKN